MNTHGKETSAEIDNFLGAYWPLSPVASEYNKFVTCCWESLSCSEFKAKVKAYESLYDQELSKLFGNDKIKPYLTLRDNFLANYSEEAFLRLTEYTMKEGIDGHVPFRYLVRSRATLQTLLEVLQDTDTFSLIDCGSGNGKITAGLTAYLPQIERVYAIDINPYASEQIKKNFNEAGSIVNRDISSRLETLNRNYEDVALISSLPLRIADSHAIILASHPTQTHEVVPLIDRFMSQTRLQHKALIVIDIDCVPPQEELIMEISPDAYWEERLRELFPTAGIDLKIIQTNPYFAQKEIGVYELSPAPYSLNEPL